MASAPKLIVPHGVHGQLHTQLGAPCLTMFSSVFSLSPTRVWLQSSRQYLSKGVLSCCGQYLHKHMIDFTLSLCNATSLLPCYKSHVSQLLAHHLTKQVVQGHHQHPRETTFSMVPSNLSPYLVHLLIHATMAQKGAWHKRACAYLQVDFQNAILGVWIALAILHRKLSAPTNFGCGSMLLQSMQG